MEETKKLIPKRRFKEFQNAGYWKRLKLNDITNRYDNLRIPVSASDRVAGDIPYYGANGIQGYIEGYTHDGEFILVAEDGANDLKNYPVKCVNGKIWVNNHAHVLQAKEQISDNKFIGYAISQINMEPYLVGGGRAKLNANIMMEIYVNIPKDLDEQVQLGKYFENIDNLITLQQHKLEKIKAMKKAYLYEMFPAEGESKPKRRFKEFQNAGEWEQRKLNEMCFLITKGTTPLDKSGEGEVNFIKVENIDSSSGKINIVNRITFEEHNGYLKRSQLKKDDILFSIAGTLGRITTVFVNVLPANTNQALAIIRLKENNLDYIKTFLKSKSVTDYIKKNPTIGAQPNLSLEQVGNLVIDIPSIDEQTKLGDFFAKLDNLITLHQSKLDKLKNLKKAYLNEMFI